MDFNKKELSAKEKHAICRDTLADFDNGKLVSSLYTFGKDVSYFQDALYRYIKELEYKGVDGITIRKKIHSIAQSITGNENARMQISKNCIQITIPKKDDE